MRYEMIDGVPTQVIEICTNCGNQPQAPAWDQCFGCGKTASEAPRKFVPAKECTYASQFNIRWTKWSADV